MNEDTFVCADCVLETNVEDIRITWDSLLVCPDCYVVSNKEFDEMDNPPAPPSWQEDKEESDREREVG